LPDDLTSENPFVRYRERLDSYLVALSNGWSDAQFVALVEQMDTAVAAVEGHGFARTPLVAGSALAKAAGLDCKLVIKNDTGNVGGSHKSRHLFGLALHHAVADPPGFSPSTSQPLAIASCGNAALSASVIAAALGQELHVFVPTWADQSIVDRLQANGATVNACERRDTELGDPAFLRYREAVEAGARPFTVQGSEVPAVIDGARTLGWEIGEELATAQGATAHIDVIYLQVGGGAFATAVSMGLLDAVDGGWLNAPPRIIAVQPEVAHPLVRAWNLLVGANGEVDATAIMQAARANPDAYMTAWENPPPSFASGILDDITYDWLGVLEAMVRTGGRAICATEDQFHRAHELALQATDIAASPTGTSGFAGLLAQPPAAGERAVVVFTG
jgi:threonine synthase